VSVLSRVVIESDDRTRCSAGEKRWTGRIGSGDQNDRSGAEPKWQVVLCGRGPLDHAAMAEEERLSLALVEVASIDASQGDRRQSYVLERLAKAEYRIDGETKTPVGQIIAGKQDGRMREPVISLEPRVMHPPAGRERGIRRKASQVDRGGHDCRATTEPPVPQLDGGCVTNGRNGDDVGFVNELERSSIQLAERGCRQIDDDRRVRMPLPEVRHARKTLMVDVIHVRFRFG
jgi:hypothetical protein